MKNILLMGLLLIAVGSAAQNHPDFKALRYDEDYSIFRHDTVKKDWYRALKFTPLNASGDVYLSFGGDLRYQYFYEKNGSWGEDPRDNDGYVLGRYLLHADFHAGKYFRTFLQIQGSTADGKLNPGPVDSNPLEVHQAFADLNFANTADNRLVLRVGRQELSYGSQRLVALREGPNNRQSFDAVKLIAATANYSADFFYSHYVVASEDIFDDDSSPERQFWGSYLVANKVPLVKNIDLYYLGYQRVNAQFYDGSGTEKRHSVGTRLWGKYGNLRYDAEAVYQFGSLGENDISAWTASLNTGYRFSTLILHPEIGMKCEIISGDKRSGDGQLETFNPLFPRGAYFGLASVIGPSNLVDLHPSLNFELSDKIDWIIDYDVFWRYSSNDGIYRPNVSLIFPENTNRSKKIGNQLESDIVFQPNQYLYFRIEATWFDAGDYLQASGAGKNIFFAGATMQLHF